MKKTKLKKISIFTFVILIITLIAAIVFMVFSCVDLYINRMITSFPWYSGIHLTMIYFGIPIIIEVVFFLYFYIRYKKSENL